MNPYVAEVKLVWLVRLSNESPVWKAVSTNAIKTVAAAIHARLSRTASP